jgi:heme-degrading monooxygenase HmoA
MEPKFVEMDETVTIFTQLEQNKGPVILINKFNVKPEEGDQFLKAWADHSAYFKQQPGFISTQLHRGIGGSSVFVNYAVWESTEFFKKSLNNPESKSLLDKYPPGTIASPHLFEKVAVPGICVK